MSATIITKKTIAKSFKNIMMTTPIQQISIRQIMDDANIRRQTFYDHFYDKYQLTTWIYEQDFKEYIQDYINYDPVDKIIVRFLNYLKDNHTFYQNALSYHDQNAFEETMRDHFFELSKEILMIEFKKNNTTVSQDEFHALAHFISFALVGIIIDWIDQDCDQDVDSLVTEIMICIERMSR